MTLRPPLAFLTPLLVIMASVNGGEEQSPAKPPGVNALPDWAIVRLRLKALGTSLERLSNFVDGLYPNAGPIVRTTIGFHIFAPLPLESGKGSLDAQQPATVFLLAPAQTKGPLEKAMILPVLDAKALKDAIKIDYEVTEDDSDLKFLVPQGFDKPEKEFILRIRGKQALIATDLVTLKDLEQLPELKAEFAETSALQVDTEISVNFSGLRQRFQKQMESVLNMALMMLPTQTKQGMQAYQNALDGSKELERLDMRVNFEGEELEIVGQLQAVADTPTALLWSKKAPSMDANLLSRMPRDSLLYLQAPIQNWVWTELSTADAVESFLGSDDEESVNALKYWKSCIFALAKEANGEAAISIRPLPNASLQLIAAIESEAPDKASVALKRYVLALTRILNLGLNKVEGSQQNSDPILKLIALESSKIEGFPSQGYRFEVKLPEARLSKIESYLKPLLGWPAEIHWTELDKGLVVLLGPQGPESLARLAKLSQKDVSESLAGDPMLKQSYGRTYDGTDFWSLIKPLGALRVLMNHAPLPAEVQLADLFEGLADSPVHVALETGSERAALRLRINGKTIKNFYGLYQRMNKNQIDLEEWLQSMLGTASK